MSNLCERCEVKISSSFFFGFIRFITYAAAFYFLVKFIFPLLMPFIFGFGIAAIVQKPALLLSKRIPKMSKRLCCVILTTGIILVSVVLIFGVACSLCGCAMKICPCIPQYYHQFVDFIHSHAQSSKLHSGNRFFNYVSFAIDWLFDFFGNNFNDYIPSLLTRSTAMLSGIPSFLAAASFAIISALLACGDFDNLKEAFVKLLPQKYKEITLNVIKSFCDTVTSLLKTYGTLMLITFCELVAGLAVIRFFGCDTGNIITTALIISIIDILPILGTGTVLVPWGIFELVTGNTMYGILLLILFAIISLVRNFMEPKLMGNRLGLSPFITLACVYIGAMLFGALGIIILPLTIIVLRDIFQNKRSTSTE